MCQASHQWGFSRGQRLHHSRLEPGGHQAREEIRGSYFQQAGSIKVYNQSHKQNALREDLDA